MDQVRLCRRCQPEGRHIRDQLAGHHPGPDRRQRQRLGRRVGLVRQLEVVLLLLGGESDTGLGTALLVGPGLAAVLAHHHMAPDGPPHRGAGLLGPRGQDEWHQRHGARSWMGMFASELSLMTQWLPPGLFLGPIWWFGYHRRRDSRTVRFNPAHPARRRPRTFCLSRRQAYYHGLAPALWLDVTLLARVVGRTGVKGGWECGAISAVDRCAGKGGRRAEGQATSTGPGRQRHAAGTRQTNSWRAGPVATGSAGMAAAKSSLGVIWPEDSAAVVRPQG